MPNAPESYLDQRRPPLSEALQAEGGTLEQATASLKQKGYFTSSPRPWKLGFLHRGFGSGDFAVLDRFGDLVAETPHRENAELIIAAVNAYNSES